MDWLHIAFTVGCTCWAQCSPESSSNNCYWCKVVCLDWKIFRKHHVHNADCFFPTTGQQICWLGAGQQFKQAPWLHFWVIVSTCRRQFVNHHSFLLCMQVLFQGTEISKLGFSEALISARATLLKIKPQAFYARTIQGKKTKPAECVSQIFLQENWRGLCHLLLHSIGPKSNSGIEMEILLTFLFNTSGRWIRNRLLIYLFIFKNVKCLGEK